MFIQGGHIIPRRDRPRRSSALMRWDPFTLVVTLNKDGIAQGSLYIDDGAFDYQEGAYIHRQLLFHDSILSSVDISHTGPRTDEFLKEMKNVTVERVVVVDPPPEWRDKKSTQVHEKDSGDVYDVAVTYHEMSDGRSDYVVVKKPNMNIGSTWEIKF
ncbi:glucosidase II [Paecilomyces lecythidis]|uniref:Glucosidase II n=1 Tax=Paecilomyces lecythidis TaxID=3004212 RepID=A0ABR3Y662_9EURO